ncbi:DUF6527 family protein [Henriciella sp.]|uniref:DUF6527 family protein n=1 Tax=Henriciella sp. TaxID=1968823 RepID=UPI00261A7D50|nr:DUF6527 family protein [Henriciella sp.]
MKHKTIQHQFVEAIPNRIERDILYVSLEFATAVHLCQCGCGLEVVAPLSPTDWRMTFDGVSVSLHPSIGNWSFPCRSHYWIRGGRIQWASDMPNSQISGIRQADKKNKKQAFERQAWHKRLWSQVLRLFNN